MRPIVSVIVANFNGAPYLAEALHSILGQTLSALEVILVDDASTDDSVAIAQAIAAGDVRLRIVELTANSGPAAARNRAIALAVGRWIAIVDSDDIIHPERLARLVTAGEAQGADIVADDLLVFHNGDAVPPARLLAGARAAAPSWIDAQAFVSANRLYGRGAALGYLKPLIRARVLTDFQVSYAEGLRIAEDYDLVLRLLCRGARYYLLPELLYFYRRHAGSISHRLSPATLHAMLAADTSLRAWLGRRSLAPLRRALDRRRASIHTALAVEQAVAGLKAREPGAALVAVVRNPSALPVLARLFTPAALVGRLRRSARRPAAGLGPSVCVLSRQRLTPGSSGSSAYLLSLCRALRASGFSLTLICPSPAVLGRVPLLRIDGDGDVFDRVVIRGTLRIGPIFIARDPRVFLRAALGMADRLARSLGIKLLAGAARPAPYAVGLPWTNADRLFVATEAHRRADVVLADYGFLTPGIPYVLRPGATSAVLMHDLFSARAAGFSRLGGQDSVSALDAASEAALLGAADLVIAIQHEEAAAARGMLPAGAQVLVAPMAMDAVAQPQAGEGGGLLFVGSATAPNVDGMRWFLAEIWPLIRARHPHLVLRVAGSVCGALLGRAEEGVLMLGRVADLALLYRRAEVVISPLRTGSGLKIKLVEALAHGKPVVATTLTAQGVAGLLDGAVALADTPADFADEVVRLLDLPRLRETRAEAALGVARRSFSADAAYGEVVAHLQARLGGGLQAAPAHG